MEKIKLKVLSFAKLHALIFAIAGVIAGMLYSFGGLVIDVLVSLSIITSTETLGLSYGTILAFGALISMPILFAIVGFIVGIIEAFLYNLFTKWFRIKIDLH